MTYAITDTVATAIIGAITAIALAVLAIINARVVARKIDPLAAKVQTIQVNTDGRLDELIRLNRAQRTATTAGVQLAADDKAKLIVAVGVEPLPLPTEPLPEKDPPA